MYGNKKPYVEFDVSQCKGSINKSVVTEELAERWFGKYYGNRLVLDLVEISYLISQGKISVKSNNENIESIEELVRVGSVCFDKSFWPMLSVYKDLRDRGRKVRVIGPMRLIVKDKTGDLRLVYVLEEKYEVEIDSLRNIVEDARRNNLSATLAIVSLHGELTYYDLIQADLRVEKIDGVQST